MKAAAINKLTSTVAHVHLLLNKVCRQWRSVNLQLTAMFRQCECHFYAYTIYLIASGGIIFRSFVLQPCRMYIVCLFCKMRSLFLVKGSQWNLMQIFVMWEWVLWKDFQAHGCKVKVLQQRPWKFCELDRFWNADRNLNQTCTNTTFGRHTD